MCLIEPGIVKILSENDEWLNIISSRALTAHTEQPFHVNKPLQHYHYLEWLCWLHMHNTWEMIHGCYCILFLGASPLCLNRHSLAEKGTSQQHWRLAVLIAKPGRKKKKGGKTQKPRAATHYSASPSFSLCFPCLSHPCLCQSASGPSAGSLPSLSLGTHQLVDLAWMLALSANYTVYLTTVTWPKRFLLLFAILSSCGNNTSVNTSCRLMRLSWHWAVYNSWQEFLDHSKASIASVDIIP